MLNNDLLVILGIYAIIVLLMFSGMAMDNNRVFRTGFTLLFIYMGFSLWYLIYQII